MPARWTTTPYACLQLCTKTYETTGMLSPYRQPHVYTPFQFTLDLECLRRRSQAGSSCHGHLTEIMLDLKCLHVHCRQVAPIPCEFPTINNAFACTCMCALMCMGLGMSQAAVDMGQQAAQCSGLCMWQLRHRTTTATWWAWPSLTCLRQQGRPWQVLGKISGA